MVQSGTRQVVEAYIWPLLRVARRYLRKEGACDAVQETFVKLLSATDLSRGFGFVDLDSTHSN